MLKLDIRDFSRAAYEGLETVKQEIYNFHQHPEKTQVDCKKASGVVQGLSTYISTWGLHRLSGDGVKYSRGDSGTRYKGIVYQQFLIVLASISGSQLDLNDPRNSIQMNLQEYTGLNRLAIALAREWSFWAEIVLGKAEGQ